MADNNTLRKDLGPVTAYAIAVEAGFEGTQEEWVRRISSSVDQQSFDTLAASVASGDAALSDKIDTDVGTEAAARSAADTAEAAARSAADTAEATARETADTAQSGRIDALSETVAGNDTTLRNILVHKPADSYSPDGTNGQVLMTHGDGTTEWSSFGQPTPEQAAAAVSAWLDAHPEATTTVVDGSITKAKLDSELKDRVNLATNSLAPIFQQATANDPGTYVSIADRLYYLPEGHTADVTWENTTKVEVQTTSEIKNLSDDVSRLKSAISEYDGINPITITAQDGKKFITPTGNINSASGNYHISTPIPVTAGECVSFVCTVAGASIAVISLCDSNTQNITPVVRGTGNNEQHKYTYNVQNDGFVVLSYRFDLPYNLTLLGELSNTKIAEKVTSIEDNIETIDSTIGNKLDSYISIEYTISNSRVSYPDGNISTSNGTRRTDYIPCKPGIKVDWYGWSFYYNNSAIMYCVAFFNASKQFISGITQIDGSSETTSQLGTISTIAPENAAYVISCSHSTSVVPYLHIYDIDLSKIEKESHEAYLEIPITKQIIQSPVLSNGSGGNPNNANGVTARAVPIVNNAQLISFKCSRAVSDQGNYYRYDVSAFKGASWYRNMVENISPDTNGEIIIDPSAVIYGDSEVDGFGVTIWEYDSNGDLQTLRIGDFSGDDIIVRYIYPDAVQTKREIENDEIEHKVLNARHAPGNSGQRLTLLHFSDLHANIGALSRIVADAGRFADLIDDKICTGDIVGNTYAEITSWWDKSILTCIGNHDTASYSGGVYDWTALSMANRDAYYIAPFESEWGIVHTPGTSYYYKDYPAPKVRMIVMDAMLYSGTLGTEAEAQTEWLANLLSDAITNSYHVLIAIHAPHGGATAKECSFSRYNQASMPTYQDCNTPQAVIDAVASAINNGLHFVGYIVGHTHQDNIWDAENDGTQLMYCVTCATTTAIQWRNSDQDRNNDIDAYNLITIDTANMLVKIVRGGGADIDDKMRARKSICINYSTGQIVGEVL